MNYIFSNQSFLPDFLSLNFNMFNQTTKSNYNTGHISLSGISSNNWIAFLKVLQNQFWSYKHFTTTNSTQSTKGFINLVPQNLNQTMKLKQWLAHGWFGKKQKTKTKKKQKTKKKTKQNHTSSREVAVKKMVVVNGATAGDSGSSLIVARRSLLVSPSHVVQPLDIWWF